MSELQSIANRIEHRAKQLAPLVDGFQDAARAFATHADLRAESEAAMECLRLTTELKAAIDDLLDNFKGAWRS